MNAAIPVPVSEEEITREWLGAALAQSHPDATFGSLRRERIGEDFGFASRIFRYRWQDSDGSKSLVVKLWNTDIAGIGEVRFFQSFQDVGARIPACYFSGLDEEKSAAVLVLEDIQNAVQGDVLEPVGLEQAKGIALSLAAMHARWMESPQLSDHDWMTDISNWQPEAGWFESRRALFKERFQGRLQGLARDLLDRIEMTQEIVNGRLADAPQTLLHGDFHLDNIVFEKPDQPVLLDWSRPVIGPPAYNLAELLLGMIPLQLFDSIFETYLAAFNRAAASPIDKAELDHRLSGAFLRRFAMRTCGTARWEPKLPRAIETIERGLQRTNESVEFWRERDPELFAFLSKPA